VSEEGSKCHTKLNIDIPVYLTTLKKVVRRIKKNISMNDEINAGLNNRISVKEEEVAKQKRSKRKYSRLIRE
jgi:hypothetical protein